MKIAGQVLADIAEQTVTPVLATYFEGAKTDGCSSLLLFSQCICYASSSQTVRRDAPVHRFNFPKTLQDNLVLCH